MTLEQMHKPAATHEQIAARLKSLKEGASDVSKLPVFHHNALDLALYVGPMSGPEYDGWQARKHLDQARHEQSGGAQNGARVSTSDSDAYLLEHAVWTGDGRLLDSALVQEMMKAPQCGPSNFALIRAVVAQNPPREQLTAEVAVMFAASQTDFVLWELLFSSGLGRALIDFMAPSATPEEKELASHNIKKAEEAVHAMRPFLHTKHAARSLGITFGEAAQIVAHDAVRTASGVA